MTYEEAPWRGYPIATWPLLRSNAAATALTRSESLRDENRNAAIRHARAAVSYGGDYATDLAFGAFAAAMVEHDRVTALEAFQQALALSPSLLPHAWLLASPVTSGGRAEP